MSMWKHDDDSPALPPRAREHHGDERDYGVEELVRRMVEVVLVAPPDDEKEAA